VVTCRLAGARLHRYRCTRSGHTSRPHSYPETQYPTFISLMSSLALLVTELQVCRISPSSAAPCPFPSYLSLPSPWLARRGESTRKSARCVVYRRPMYAANGSCHIGRGKVSFSTQILSRTGNGQSSFGYVPFLCVIPDYTPEKCGGPCALHLDFPTDQTTIRCTSCASILKRDDLSPITCERLRV
jgi:hypothetical protein